MKFIVLSDLLSKIEPIGSRIEIRDLIKEFLKSLELSDVDKTIYLLQSEFFRSYEGKELNVGNNIMEDAIARAYGFPKDEIKEHHMHSGDLGLTTEHFSALRRQKSLFSKKLKIRDVYSELRKVAEEEGKSSTEYKLQRLVSLLNNASSEEAKYIVKISLGTLRISLGIQTLIESVALIVLEKKGFDNYKEVMSDFKEIKNKIERKYNITNDLGKTISVVLSEGYEKLDDINVEVLIPIKSALCEREKSAEGIIKRLGKCIVEGKYDGFRVQLHHKKNVTKIYSRRGEDLTYMFPEYVEIFKTFRKDFIIDGEAIGYNSKTGKYLTFQETIKRRRKYDVAEITKQIPVMLHIFDIMFFETETIDLPLKERRVLAEQLVKEVNNPLVRLTESIYTEDPIELSNFFNHCLDEGLEGVIAKDLNKAYVPGSRDFAWIKLKKNYIKGQVDSIDLAVIGYFLGKGKYASKPSSLLCAVYDAENNIYKAVAKVASGLTEDQINIFVEDFKDLELDKKPDNFLSALEPYKYLKPSIIIEVVTDEITKSPLYKDTKDGFSLRFPRFITIQDDRTAQETTSEKELKRMYELQSK